MNNRDRDLDLIRYVIAAYRNTNSGLLDTDAPDILFDFNEERYLAGLNPGYLMENESNTDTIGSFVKKGRAAQCLTLEELARKLGTSKGYIHDIESGRASNPSFEFTMRLFDVLNLNACAVWRRMD